MQEIPPLFVRKTTEFRSNKKGNARNWVIQIAYCRAFDRRTYLTRRGFYRGTNIDDLKNTQDRNADFETQVLARVSGEQLRAAFDQLPERQRTTLELFFFEGYSLREISDRLSETLENTRHYYYRGIERLRKVTGALEVVR